MLASTHFVRHLEMTLEAHLNGGTVFRESDRPYAESSEKFVMSNRIGRLEFLFWCCIPLIVGSIVFSIVALSVGAIDANTPAGDPKFRSLLAPVALIVSIVALRAAVSRLHDLGLVGWAVVLAFRTFGRYRSVSGSFHFTGTEGEQRVRRATDIFRALAKIQANHIALFLNGKPARLILVSYLTPSLP